MEGGKLEGFEPVKAGWGLMKLMVSILTQASFASSMVSRACWPPGVLILNGDLVAGSKFRARN